MDYETDNAATIQNDNLDEATIRQVLRVRINSVISKPQVRKLFNHIDELATSLARDGQQTPIIVSPMDSNGKYVIQKGERRWRACKHANIPFIDIIINNAEQSFLDETAGQLVENIQRENLTALEIANALNEFVDQNWKQSSIASRIGKSQKFVSMHLSLLKLPDCALQLYEKNVCTDADTLNLLRQLHDIDPERCKQACEEAVTKGISRARCREIISMAKRLKTYADSTSAVGITSSSLFTNSTYLGPQSLHPETFQLLPAEQIIIDVRIRRGRGKKRGVLLTDRVSKNSKYAWIQLSPPENGDEILCVKTSSIEIIGIRTQSPVVDSE